MLFAIGILTGMTSKDRLAAEQKKVLEMIPIMTAWKEAYSKWAETQDRKSVV